MSNSSIWPIDRILSGATTLGQSGPCSETIKGYFAFLKSLAWLEPQYQIFFIVTFRTLVGGVWLLCCIAMIQLYKYTDAGKSETLTTLRCSGTKRLLTSWLQFFDTRRESHNFYYADCTIWPKKRAAHPVAPSWTGPAQSQVSTNFFFKITKFSAHRFRAWRHSHPSPILSGVFIMTFVIIISSACERELYSMCVHRH